LFSSTSFKIIKEKYGSDQDIKRFCIFHSDFKEYEICLPTLSVLFIPQVSSSFLKPFEFKYSEKESIQEVVSACKSLLESSFDHISYNFDVFRIWKADKNALIVQPSEKLFIPSAEAVTSFTSSESLFLFEFQKADGSWTVFSQLESSCPNCLIMSELLVTCPKCKTIQYCSKTCLDQHVFIHIGDCCEMIERNGKTGLGNLGNTCYMNSVLQCLAHTDVLKNYFLNKMFLHESQGNSIVTLAFGKLLFQLWGINRGVVFPSEFKKEFCKKFSMFSGVSQHDSHEFLIHLLDSINDELMSGETSVIGRNFYGISETCLKCFECGKMSFKEEKFLTLPLQVANLEKVQITLYVVFIDPGKDVGRRVINCFFSWNTKDLKELLENELACKILLCFYDFLHFRGEVKNTDIGDYVGKILVAYQAPCEDYIVCSFNGIMGKIMFDRVIFFDFEVNLQLLNKLNEKIQEVFYLKFGNLDRWSSIKFDYNKEDIVYIEEPFSKYSKILKAFVLVNEKNAEIPKKFLDLDAINVGIPLDYNIYSALKIMTHAEHLDEENKCFCETCDKKTQMIKYFSIKQFPKVLIFQLLKFKSSLAKINTLVQFPVENLELDDFGCGFRYELFATCNHFGSYSFGHYTASIKSDDAWFDFNDSVISSISQIQIVNSSAYLLFYIRKN
jgi:ubiquitin C-terminal hydrolase